MRNFFWVLLLPFFLHAQNAIQPLDPETTSEYDSTQQIEAELDDAEAQFQKALKMFNPWYTGPLITPGASMMAVGEANTQPYLFVVDNYATFDKNRKSVSNPSNLVQLKGSINLQTGITDNFDLNVTIASTGNWQFSQSNGGFGDTTITGGFLVNKQTRYAPQVKFTIAETFPTGKYQHLNTNGLHLDAIGAGAYTTQFGLVLSKVFLWTTQYPMNARIFFGYQLSTPVRVEGFNTYGGGFGTKGKVHPGNTFSADFGYEISLSQNWVLATDVVYSATNQTTFHGTPGVLATGERASNGGGYSDNLSISPAIEYNWNSSLGIIAGAQFSVYGRNSSNFASGIISVTYSFP
jgi:hypothetical protein